jgi:hypothetical protein
MAFSDPLLSAQFKLGLKLIERPDINESKGFTDKSIIIFSFSFVTKKPYPGLVRLKTIILLF